MSSNNERWSKVDHSEREQSKQAYWRREGHIEETIDRCSRAMARGDKDGYLYAATKMHEELVPTLEQHCDRDLLDFDADLDDHPDWNYLELSQWLEQRTAYQHVFNGSYESTPATSRAGAQRTLKAALRSLTAIAEHKGTVKGAYDNEADAVGLSGEKMGTVYKDPTMPFDDEVDVIREVGTIKSMYCGDTNAGKSTASEMQFQDYYLRNFIAGCKDTKCIDPVDMSVAENIFYDVPQQDDDLRKALDDMNLPQDFIEADIEDYDPSMEVFVPLSDRLEDPDAELPYDTESEAFVPKPFVIPASDITQELFIAVVTARVSATQEDRLREVYEAVDRERENWRLEHLVEEVASREDMSEKHKRQSIRVIRSIQDFGFVREGTNSEYTLDWDRIFRETETITVFNQSLFRQPRKKLFVLAWLFEKMWHKRTSLTRYPQMVLILREMWKYAPQKERTEDDAIAQALQDRIVSLLLRYFRQNRDVRTHITADTQNLKDVNISVREEFNRFCVFTGKFSVAEKVFNYTGNEKMESFVRRIPPDVGHCGIVGVTGPSMDESRVEYIAPVELAPPYHHHHDKDDGNGFEVRTELVEHEELRHLTEEDIDWPVQVPEDHRIPPADELLEDEGEDEGSNGGRTENPNKAPHEIRMEARELRKRGYSYSQIAKAIPNNPDTGNPYYRSAIGDWVSDIDPDDYPEMGPE